MAPLIYVDRSMVREGREKELRSAFRDLTAFVEENEPWLAAYAVYFSPDERRTAVVSVHVDEDSLRRHMEVIQDRLAPFADLLELRSIEVFGEVSDELRATLRNKAELLGAGGISVEQAEAGFLRRTTPAPRGLAIRHERERPG